jgi:ADP-ribosyl-[dinitrogen reductase] hydrolase
MIDYDIVLRAQGCLLGQFAGDALGNPVEFQKPEQIRKQFPNGVRDLLASDIWETIPGQLTDDSEMALALARTLIKLKTYDAQEVRRAYVEWYDSDPFDCGGTVEAGLRGDPNSTSEANGALMRISPLGIFGVNHQLEEVAKWARQDALLTHPNPICQQANMLFAMAISFALKSGCSPEDLFKKIQSWAKQLGVKSKLIETIDKSASEPPEDYVYQRGWVLIAFQNALWQLTHAPSLEEGIVDSVMRGGDTDTNGAIAGALLGAVYGKGQVPKRWIDCLLNCRPKTGEFGVLQPRPEIFWPTDVLVVATDLLTATQ